MVKTSQLSDREFWSKFVEFTRKQKQILKRRRAGVEAHTDIPDDQMLAYFLSCQTEYHRDLERHASRTVRRDVADPTVLIAADAYEHAYPGHGVLYRDQEGALLLNQAGAAPSEYNARSTAELRQRVLTGNAANVADLVQAMDVLDDQTTTTTTTKKKNTTRTPVVGSGLGLRRVGAGVDLTQEEEEDDEEQEKEEKTTTTTTTTKKKSGQRASEGAPGGLDGDSLALDATGKLTRKEPLRAQAEARVGARWRLSDLERPPPPVEGEVLPILDVRAYMEGGGGGLDGVGGGDGGSFGRGAPTGAGTGATTKR